MGKSVLYACSDACYDRVIASILRAKLLLDDRGPRPRNCLISFKKRRLFDTITVFL